MCGLTIPTGSQHTPATRPQRSIAIRAAYASAVGAEGGECRAWWWVGGVVLGKEAGRELQGLLPCLLARCSRRRASCCVQQGRHLPCAAAPHQLTELGPELRQLLHERGHLLHRVEQGRALVGERGRDALRLVLLQLDLRQGGVAGEASVISGQRKGPPAGPLCAAGAAPRAPAARTPGTPSGSHLALLLERLEPLRVPLQPPRGLQVGGHLQGHHPALSTAHGARA